MFNRKTLICSALSLAALTTSAAHAHFPWLVRGEDGKATLFFGETLSERTYKLPASIAKAEVTIVNAKGDLEPVAVTAVDSDSLIGLQSVEAVPADAFLVSQVTFGIYHGSRLNYHSMRHGGKLPKAPVAGEKPAQVKNAAARELFAHLTDTDSGVDVLVTLKGKPLVDVEVHLYCAAGHEEGTAKTDSSGKVSFTDKQVEDGLNAIMVGYNVKAAGKLNEVTYEAESHYLTITFDDPEQPAKEKAAEKATSTKFAPLPFAITSFGAARVGDSVFVYGGHMGDAHTYSNEAQSNKLLRLDLKKPEVAWEEIATGERQQGLGMVADKNQVILIGGFTAKNKKGEKQDLHSLALVRAFDLTSKMWSELPSLPEPRSSHDAAKVGDTLYVVGGWNMAGEGNTTWHTTAWSMDLSAADRKWVALPDPAFKRRAVAAVEHHGKLFVVGGMNDDGEPTKAVAIFDPATQGWSEAPELIGEKAMAGFGASAWSAGGKLIVTTYEGDIEQWDESANNWKVLGKSSDARFFHRLMPIDDKSLIAIGGANMESGKFLNLEVIHAN